jgi:hypothetical protein
MDAAEAALRNATDHNPRATIDAGYNYCKARGTFIAKKKVFYLNKIEKKFKKFKKK